MPAPTAIRGTDAIRAGIALLAGFAFSLSYDALRQMAVAIHIRGPLTYAFPLVIDGFIAIGVGALLMLRTAPTLSRAYVWALVGAATVTSIWANALHAVRLNQQTRPGGGLRLDDLTVGALSAIAPLALAGAVHLYIVVHRHSTPRPQEPHATERDNLADVASDVPDVASDNNEAAQELQPSAESQGHKTNEIAPERLALARTAPLGRKGRASRRHIEDTFRSQGLTIGRKEADMIKKVLQAELDAAVSQRHGELDAAPVGAA
ncbi:hypothetical protein C9F11_17770 [Streptomyces sp. YIM 121038]|uniref:DUF2637 domain-containing protein n=1 Tax=Streptomyces sp. YIM 121038 TaxID=2136401 RepID=UPI001164EF65|nr:DUF2637 domain-containing protein [Streptomyces sp. YIM 121038]QCX77206.1 hypothetical protein C9F11_17770 [Streptomyces sp. YIM 121038]